MPECVAWLPCARSTRLAQLSTSPAGAAAEMACVARPVPISPPNSARLGMCFNNCRSICRLAAWQLYGGEPSAIEHRARSAARSVTRPSAPGSPATACSAQAAAMRCPPTAATRRASAAASRPAAAPTAPDPCRSAPRSTRSVAPPARRCVPPSPSAPARRRPVGDSTATAWLLRLTQHHERGERCGDRQCSRRGRLPEPHAPAEWHDVAAVAGGRSLPRSCATDRRAARPVRTCAASGVSRCCQAATERANAGSAGKQPLRLAAAPSPSSEPSTYSAASRSRSGASLMTRGTPAARSGCAGSTISPCRAARSSARRVRCATAHRRTPSPPAGADPPRARPGSDAARHPPRC